METPDLLAQGEMDYQVLVVDNQLGHRVEDTQRPLVNGEGRLAALAANAFIRGARAGRKL